MDVRNKVKQHHKRFLGFYLILMILLVVLPLAGILSDTEELRETPPSLILLSLSLYGGLILLLCIPAIVCLVMLRRGKFTAPFDAYVSGLDENGKARLDKAMRENDLLEHAALAEDCVVVANKGNLSVAPFQDLVWLYTSIIKLLPFWETRFLVMVTRQKRLVQIILAKNESEPDVTRFIKAVQEKRPGVLVGYQQPWIGLFSHDFQKMVALSDCPQDERS